MTCRSRETMNGLGIAATRFAAIAERAGGTGVLQLKTLHRSYVILVWICPTSRCVRCSVVCSATVVVKRKCFVGREQICRCNTGPISSALLCARLLVRIHMQNNAGWGDWLMLAATVRTSVILTSKTLLTYLVTIDVGFDHHFSLGMRSLRC